MNNKPSIDFSKAWNSLKPELDMEQARREKKKRRFIIFWFSAIAIGLVSGALLLHNSHSENKNIALKQNTSAVVNTIVQKQNNEANHAETTNQKNLSNTKSVEYSSSTKNFTAQQNIFSAQEKEKVAQQNISSTKALQLTAQQKKSSAQQNYFSSKNNKPSELQKKSATEVTDFVNRKNELTALQNISTVQAIKSIEKQQFEEKTNSSIANHNQIQTIKTEQKKENTNTAIVANNETANTATTSKNLVNNKTPKTISYGLQFNLPIVSSLNTLDANAENNIASILIPTIWIQKTISKKYSLQLFANPYANYYVNNKAIINNTQINTVTQQATQLLPQQNSYTQTLAVNKLVGLEAGLMAQHKITERFNIGLGFSYFATQSMLLKNIIIKDKSTTIKNDIYSVGKSNSDWQSLQANFLMARFELNYQFKKLNAGLSFSKPLSNIFNNIELSKTPVNTNLFVRWKIK